MNKNDLKLIIIILTIAIITFFMIAIIDKGSNKQALVYYDNNLVLVIDLNNKEQTEYIVEGYNGPVKIVTNNGKVKVEEEDSPLHLCSKQGFIEKSYETIVCLPNKIVIKISGKEQNNLDAVLRWAYGNKKN